jgi:ferredoxin-like protein FixX
MEEDSSNHADSPNVESPLDLPQAVSHPVEPTGAFSQSRSQSAIHLNSRSCMTCRKRKVRCDKRSSGCLNCAKARIVCVYPSKERPPRKTRKPPDTELLARLNKLEGVVQSLGAQVDDEGRLATTSQHQQKATVAEDDPKSRRPVDIDKEVGRLVINEGKSRYVSSAFWTSMHDEVSKSAPSHNKCKMMTTLQDFWYARYS